MVWLDEDTFAPPENISMRFEAHPSLMGGGWIGLFPGETLHANLGAAQNKYLGWMHVSDLTGSTLTFHGPNTPGEYSFGLLDISGQEVVLVPSSVAE